VKARLCVLVGLTVIACAVVPRAASSGLQSLQGQAAKVFFHGKGPDREVRRFQKFLEIALDDLDMTRTDSARDADMTVNVDITREEKTEHLYAPVVWITVASADHQEYSLQSCNVVSDSTSIFDEPIKSLEAIKLPDEWKKRGRHFAIYMNDAEIQGFKELVPLLRRKLMDENYQITQARGEADAELKSIKLQKLAVPMRAVTLHRSYEVLDRQSNRFFYTVGSGSSDVTYKGVEPGIKLENLPCGRTIEHFAVDYDGAWRDARDIAKNIRKHIDAAHSN
jgi:hypothetical protein